MHNTLGKLKLGIAAFVMVAVLSACQISTTSAPSGSRQFTETSPAAFAAVLSDICAANVPSASATRAALRANGFASIGQSGGASIFMKGPGHPVVSLSRGDTTLICSVSALNPPGFFTDMVASLTTTFGFAESGSFLSKGRVAGTWTTGQMPEGPVLTVALIQLNQ